MDQQVLCPVKIDIHAFHMIAPMPVKTVLSHLGIGDGQMLQWDWSSFPFPFDQDVEAVVFSPIVSISIQRPDPKGTTSDPCHTFQMDVQQVAPFLLHGLFDHLPPLLTSYPLEWDHSIQSIYFCSMIFRDERCTDMIAILLLPPFPTFPQNSCDRLCIQFPVTYGQSDLAVRVFFQMLFGLCTFLFAVDRKADLLSERLPHMICDIKTGYLSGAAHLEQGLYGIAGP